MSDEAMTSFVESVADLVRRLHQIKPSGCRGDVQFAKSDRCAYRQPAALFSGRPLRLATERGVWTRRAESCRGEHLRNALATFRRSRPS